MWSTVTSTPWLVPQSLAYLSNQPSYEGTKWLHWRILSVFCWRLIQIVGPSATATAATVAVVTNSRRSIPFRGFVMDLPSVSAGRGTRSGAQGAPLRTRVSSDRVQHADGVLVSV